MYIYVYYVHIHVHIHIHIHITASLSEELRVSMEEGVSMLESFKRTYRYADSLSLSLSFSFFLSLSLSLSLSFSLSLSLSLFSNTLCSRHIWHWTGNATNLSNNLAAPCLLPLLKMTTAHVARP